MTRKSQKRGAFGTAHKLPSGRYRAMYYGTDGRRYTAPTTFTAQADARAWLALRQAEIIKQTWAPPAPDQKPSPKLTFGTYAEKWWRHRNVKDRTREHYRKLLDAKLLPTFGALPLASITADDVREWHSKFDKNAPTLRTHAYGLLRTIMATAAEDGKVAANPCVIRGASSAKRVHKIRPATQDEIATIAESMPEQYRAMVLLAGWCALRFGELTELRRRDLIFAKGDYGPEGVVRVERAVVRVGGEFQVTTPKSDAGTRDVNIPPHIVPDVQRHLDRHVEADPDALLFPAAHGGHLAPSTLYRRFYTARAVAGRPDLRWHDLRHSAAVLTASIGATLAELMARLGHSSQQAALRYQHVAAGRDREIAVLLSRMALADKADAAAS